MYHPPSINCCQELPSSLSLPLPCCCWWCREEAGRRNTSLLSWVQLKKFCNTFRSTVFLCSALTLLTILQQANEKENRALLIYLSYGNEFSASEVMLSGSRCTRSVKWQTNMHQNWQVLFWPSAFAVELFKLCTMGFKENINSAHQFYCFIVRLKHLTWQLLNVSFVLFLHMLLHLYLQIINYRTSSKFSHNSWE